MRRSWIWILVSSIVLLTMGGIFAARAQNSKPADFAERAEAVNLVRVINAAEYSYRQDHARFGGWEELYDSGVVDAVQKRFVEWGIIPMRADPEVVASHRLSLLVSPDGTAYSVSLHDTRVDACGTSLFSDQTGLIYEGTALDCPQIADGPPTEGLRRP